MLRRFATVIGLLMFTVVAVAGNGQSPAQRPAESTPATTQLGNPDVIKLVLSGLSDGFIVARIRQAPATNFDLSSDALVLLKKAGVSETVLAAMLEPTAKPSPAPAEAPAATAGQPGAEHTAAAVEPGIYLGDVAATGGTQLEPTVFSQGKSGGNLASALTYGICKAKWKAVVRSPRAVIRTRTQRPTLVFQFAQRNSALGAGGFAGWLAAASSPNEFVLARMTPKKNERGLIVGEFGALDSSSGARSEDTVPFTIEKLAPGTYRVIPEKELGSGEFCSFYAAGAGALGQGAVGKLFDFGVDPR